MQGAPGARRSDRKAEFEKQDDKVPPAGRGSSHHRLRVIADGTVALDWIGGESRETAESHMASSTKSTPVELPVPALDAA